MLLLQDSSLLYIVVNKAKSELVAQRFRSWSSQSTKRPRGYFLAFFQMIVVTLSQETAMMVDRDQDSVFCCQPQTSPLDESLVRIGDNDVSGRALGSFDVSSEGLLKGSCSRPWCTIKKLTAH